MENISGGRGVNRGLWKSFGKPTALRWVCCVRVETHGSSVGFHDLFLLQRFHLFFGSTALDANGSSRYCTRLEIERRPAWRSPAADARSAAKSAKLVAIAASDKREMKHPVRRAARGGTLVTFSKQEPPIGGSCFFLVEE
jgi:hypothetical protein